jgi:hypothetical protein
MIAPLLPLPLGERVGVKGHAARYCGSTSMLNPSPYLLPQAEGEDLRPFPEPTP